MLFFDILQTPTPTSSENQWNAMLASYFVSSNEANPPMAQVNDNGFLYSMVHDPVFIALVSIIAILLVLMFIIGLIESLIQGREDRETLDLIDPDIVARARVERTFPHLTGRVFIGDHEDSEEEEDFIDEDFFHNPSFAMRAKYV